MMFRIGGQDFEHATYDEDADVLYLRNGEPGSPMGGTTHATPEGHAVSISSGNEIVGLTIVNARWLIERDGEIAITVPDRQIAVTPADVGAALEGIAHE